MPKNDLRVTISKKLKEQSPDEMKLKNAAIFNKASAEIQRAKDVFCYVSLPEEVGTTELIKNCLDRGKNVYSPAVKGEEIRAIRLKDLSELQKGNFGILEPSGKEEKMNFDVIFIPGMAFDEKCARLGRGKGHFDKFLRRAKGKKIGLAFDFQIFPSVHPESHDVYMDEVITEKRTFFREKQF